MEGGRKEKSTSVAKDRSKSLSIPSMRIVAAARSKKVKVFCFFFSKKKFFLL